MDKRVRVDLQVRAQWLFKAKENAESQPRRLPHILHIQGQTYVLVALVCNVRELIEGVRLSQDGIVAGHAMRFDPVNLE